MGRDPVSRLWHSERCTIHRPSVLRARSGQCPGVESVTPVEASWSVLGAPQDAILPLTDQRIPPLRSRGGAPVLDNCSEVSGP